VKRLVTNVNNEHSCSLDLQMKNSISAIQMFEDENFNSRRMQKHSTLQETCLRFNISVARVSKQAISILVSRYGNRKMCLGSSSLPVISLVILNFSSIQFTLAKCAWDSIAHRPRRKCCQYVKHSTYHLITWMVLMSLFHKS